MEQAAPACGACGKPIAYRDKYMVIGGKKLHHECFSCLGCRIPIGTGGYYEDYDREGNKGPWCGHCWCRGCECSRRRVLCVEQDAHSLVLIKYPLSDG